MHEKREEERWDELTLRQRKKNLRTKSKNAVSSPTAADNENCIEEIPIEIEACQGEDYTGMIGGILKIQIVCADITTETTDAITNPANNFLKHKMGAALQISQKGGPTIQAESDAYTKQNGNVKTGKCMHTGAG